MSEHDCDRMLTFFLAYSLKDTRAHTHVRVQQLGWSGRGKATAIYEFTLKLTVGVRK